MQQQKEERGFIPVKVERGRARTWQNIRLSFSSFTNMAAAQKKRLFVYGSEGRGWDKAISNPHNSARFRSARLLPKRERAQLGASDDKKADEFKKSVKALKYGRRYNTLTQRTVERAQSAGIRIRLNSLILPYAAYKQQVKVLMFSNEARTAQSV